ncbi:MAG: GH92 family glycosyl hydrolase, partial [Desulfobacterales bacterium]|nr:GH92 family glycosyl hydrolase [Desulfobacterales bacterium]
MKKLILITLFFILSCSSHQSKKNPVDYVDPFIGTAYFAHMYPGAGLPFGMVQLSPDVYNVGWAYASGYLYDDNSIMGFSHTHFSGPGGATLGDILLMPTVNNKIQIDPGSRGNPDLGYRSRFDHTEESASPGYYSVQLKDYNIKVELTVTKRVGLHKYTFPQAENAHIIIDLGHSIGKLSQKKSNIKVINNQCIEGYKTSRLGVVYFVMEFSKPFTSFGTWNKIYPKPESGGGFINPYKTAETGRQIGVFLDYSMAEGEAVHVKVAISHVSIAGAAKNLEEELPDWDFDGVRRQAEKMWNKELQLVEVTGGSEKEKQIFYTALYHSLLSQQIFNDVDGRFFGMDGKVHTAQGYDFYPSFLAWDTYRSEQPLMLLLEPRRANDMMKSIAEKTKNFGWFPAQHTWNNFGQGMVGDHLIPMVADAYAKGIRNYDIDFLYEMMWKKATDLPPAPISQRAARRGLQYYKE